ncbi:hypothetical protein JCM31826_15800 [Thermaurantimonas aggregans]|uniref:Uncharacterized protein n=1 Tax=Thermaurantimonas aggregans TaxID=2173829 RepID=A0A401XM81_9FLAO|nr:hypothetical protein [Thermaurantimonas aggregans]MCX8147967.1 hypothetical protein [Thermaurantimonas aggregans]GCD78098.1 hypothetical protein JCM31826_15800 [Thermaurantimonas aggregans]
MKGNIDRFFKEKLEDLEIQPRQESKTIFLKKAAQHKSKQMFRVATGASAAVILILSSGYFLIKDVVQTPKTSLTIFKENEKSSDENFKPGAYKIIDKENHSTVIYSNEKRVYSRGKYATIKNDNPIEDNSLVFSQVSDFNFKDTTVTETTENISPAKPEIEIKVTGFSEQIVHYAMAESMEKQTQITFQLLNQKFIVQSPVIEEVDQAYHQLKKGIKDFSLADASRTISNNLFDRISSRKNQNQNNN